MLYDEAVGLGRDRGVCVLNVPKCAFVVVSRCVCSCESPESM